MRDRRGHERDPAHDHQPLADARGSRLLTDDARPDTDSVWRGGFRLLADDELTGFEAWGESFGEVCARAAEALFQSMGWPETFAPGPSFESTSRGVDREDVLLRLLSDLLARFETDGAFVRQARCESVGPTEGGAWEARLACDAGAVERAAERALTAVEAVAYDGLRVWEEGGLVRARVILDVR